MMTTNEIRSKYLNFFKSKNHSIIASDSVVPKDDPTVLFTTAGMQQFKPQFLGRIDGFTRASTSQKCLRTDDLDCVGKTDFHHTFFEMLGNFSFGDYFKKEAIRWAWEFLTKEIGIAKEKLWVSVYKDDEEAYGIWLNDIKVPADRIVKLGDKSNFWPSNARLNGPNGPCGPCSEIFFDYGVNPNCPNGSKCDPDCSCGRFSEVWNLVFTQFNRKDGGILEPLPAKNIDTGMGLERLAAVVQGKRSNYETDNWAAILKVIKDVFKLNNAQLTESEYRIIADHMRAVTFGLSDGVVPSNEGRGYVMRKLIVVMSDLAIRAGIVKPVIHTFVDIVVDRMKSPYPELVGKMTDVKEAIKRIEEAYGKVYKERVPEVEQKLREAGNDSAKIGDILFFYNDTHGVSLATLLIVVERIGISKDVLPAAIKTYEAKMEEQKTRSRASSKMMGDVFADQDFSLNVAKTDFVGYNETRASAKVLKVVSEGNNVKVILDRTPFYAESGGQVGDSGYIKVVIPAKAGIQNSGSPIKALGDDKAVASVRVETTQKTNDIYIHLGVIEQGVLKEGDQVEAVIDESRRVAITRNHTATHLLQSALREVLGAHVKQQGSSVDDNRLRFDFAHHKGVSAQEIERIENRLNEFIKSSDVVKKEVLPIEEAKKKGALAFFAEKYGDVVRVISIGNYSTEFCGGTHVGNTSEIAVMKVVSEGSVAQGVRRIEAVTGKEAVSNLLKQRQAEEAVRQEAERLKRLEKEKEQQQFEMIKASLTDIISKADIVNGVSLVSYVVNGGDIAMLRKISDLLKQKAKSAALIVGGKGETDASLVVSLTDDVVARGVKANDVINSIMTIFEGNGGGRPNMAQAGSKNPAKLDAAISKAKETLKAAL